MQTKTKKESLMTIVIAKTEFLYIVSCIYIMPLVKHTKL